MGGCGDMNLINVENLLSLLPDKDLFNVHWMVMTKGFVKSRGNEM